MRSFPGKGNPSNQKTVEKSVKYSQPTVNKIINIELNRKNVVYIVLLQDVSPNSEHAAQESFIRRKMEKCFDIR